MTRIDDMKEYVGPCHWSKTQWAIWKGKGCTCKEVPTPKDEVKAVVEFKKIFDKETT